MSELDPQPGAPNQSGHNSMDGLRIFIDPEASQPRPAVPTFYSCRDHGPLYRWSFAEGTNRWRAKRLNNSELTIRELSLSKWRDVPLPLQRTLRDHYQE